MITKLEGTIARRILLNYWLEPEVARRLVPEPFQVVIRNGFAVAGICLLRLQDLRPAGLPQATGLTSENMAHRIAVRYPAEEDGARVMREGVYIWRRDTGSALATRLGGLLFPGTFRDAEFRVVDEEELRFEVFTEDGAADLRLRAVPAVEWKWTLLFSRLADVCGFFQRADCGFHTTLRGDKLEGQRLLQQRWEMAPLAVSELHAAYYQNEARFPQGSVGFDSAVIMRGIPHYWQALDHVPEVAGARL
jgi:hypothetical protein